jgi:nucleotide-binding universal stress UspA family protein
MERVLVPFDGKPHSVEFLHRAIAIGRQAERITVLLLFPTPDPDVQRMYVCLQEAATGPDGYLPEIRILQLDLGADLAASIVMTARKLRADLIILAIDDPVLTIHNQAPGEPATLSELVALTSTVAVMALRHHHKDRGSPVGNRRIVVPLDGSSVSRQVLPVAVRMARVLRAPVHLVTVIDPRTALPPAYSYLPTFDAGRQDALSALQIEANSVLDQSERVLREAGFAVTSELILGHTRSCLADAIQPGDVLVMATHGSAARSGTRFGSTALHMLRESPVPVVTLRAAIQNNVQIGRQGAWDPSTSAPAATMSCGDCD